MDTIQVVLDSKLLKATDLAAKRQKVNRSALIRRALEEHLKRLHELELEEQLDACQFAGGGGWRHAQAILFEMPGSYDPQLYEVLRNDMQLSALCQKALDSPISQRIERMMRLQSTGKNAGID